jgi:antirestriction protein ArdC
VKTLAHELAHAILHEDHEDYVRNRGQYELEAESTAYVVCQTLGIDSSEYSFGYVTSWAGGGDEAQKKIRESGQKIQKAAHRIIGALEKESESAVAAA